jgi:hypothetical protein
VTLQNAPVPGPLITATALILAAIVAFAVLFTLALLVAIRLDQAETEGDA